MRILVTGGAGFIGSNFAYYIRKHRPDWEIVVFDCLTYAGNIHNLDKLDNKNYKFIKGNICDSKAINTAVANSDIVVNFAAESHVDNSIREPWPFIETNLVGTYRLLEAVKKHDKRLHHISTDEVFGDLQLSDPKFDETSPNNPSSPYSATKAGSDHLVRAWIRSYGIKATLSNCSNNYGPYQHVEKMIPRNITEILEGRKPKLYGSGANIRDWIHVDDHNAAILAIIEKGKIGETYMIGADGEKSNKEIFQLILELMGKDTDWYVTVKDRPGHDLRYAINSSKIRSELGWAPKYTDMRDGLKATIDWYVSNKDWWEPQKSRTEAMYKQVNH